MINVTYIPVDMIVKKQIPKSQIHIQGTPLTIEFNYKWHNHKMRQRFRSSFNVPLQF